MIVLITGASHTGKTAFAQKLLEKYHMPYLSIDDMGCEPERCCIYGVDYTPIQQILYNRYDRRLPTMITTNLNLELIKDRYGERLLDRFAESYRRVCLDYPSYRSHK